MEEKAGVLCAGLVGDNAVVVKVPDHGQVQYALLGVDVGNVRHPFAVGSSGVRFFLAICITSCVMLLFYTTQEVYT